MRSSKSKAMDQVKQWCGSMKEENDLLGKRKISFSDSDSEDDIGGIGAIKRTKADTSGDDDWAVDSEEDKILIGRSDVIQRAFSRANAQSNGSKPMTGTDLANSMSTTSKNVVKMEPKPSTTAQQHSNVYIVHRKDGIIKLDSSPTNKISIKGQNHSPATGGVLMVQNRDGNIIRKQIVSTSHANSITPVKVISKPDGTQVVTQMKVVPKTPTTKTSAVIAPKNEPIKIQPRPDPNQLQQIHLVTAVPNPLNMHPQRMTAAVRPTGQRSLDGRPLLPRPPMVMRTATSTSGVVGISQTRTPVRAPPPRQITPQGIQRQMAQKRNTPASTIVQVSNPGVVTTVRPKITVMNQQGKIIQKTVVSPATQVRPSPKASPAAKPQSLITPQQKMMMARRKVAEEAGVIPKSGARGSPAAAAAKGQVRPKSKVADNSTMTNKPKESKLAETDGLHMEFHEVGSESSEEEGVFPLVPTEPVQPLEPESPPRQFTLCPLTGRIIGPDGEPIEQPEPEPQSQPQTKPAPTPLAIVQTTTPATPTATIGPDGIITTVANADHAEIVLPNLESLEESTGGVVRVEMSPGGTSGTIVQTSEPSAITLSSVVVPGPDLPCLDDPSIEVHTSSNNTTVVSVPAVTATETSSTTAVNSSVQVSTVTGNTTVVVTPMESTTTDLAVTVPTTSSSDITTTILPTVEKQDATINVEGIQATATATNVKMEESGGVVTITGDDGVVYQVTGQAEDGQTLLVMRAGDGEQQCVYVTAEQQGEEGSVLTLDHAVAEAVAQLMPEQINLTPQFYVKEGTEGTSEGTVTTSDQQMVMSIMENADTVVAATQEDGENQAQVVAQVIRAEEPTSAGTRRVVLLLPDGNLMMTEVDEEQYAALDLDK